MVIGSAAVSCRRLGSGLLEVFVLGSQRTGCPCILICPRPTVAAVVTAFSSNGTTIVVLLLHALHVARHICSLA